jgi:hypothetical protein
MSKAAMMKAEPYRPYAMGSTGNASNMYIRQFNFPAEWDRDVDKITSADSDRLLSWDYDGFRKTLQKHIGTGEGAIGDWTRNATDEEAMAFIKEALKVAENYPDVVWTGYRVTGTVHRGNGFPIYTLTLFANRSGVAVYSDELAPNVEKPSAEHMFGGFMFHKCDSSFPDWNTAGKMESVRPFKNRGRG